MPRRISFLCVWASPYPITAAGQRRANRISADDSKAYMKPWTAGPVRLAWHPDWELVEAFCIQEDNGAFKKSVIDPSWTPGQAPKGK
jgi:hypothetical protein